MRKLKKGLAVALAMAMTLKLRIIDLIPEFLTDTFILRYFFKPARTISILPF